MEVGRVIDRVRRRRVSIKVRVGVEVEAEVLVLSPLEEEQEAEAGRVVLTRDHRREGLRDEWAKIILIIKH